MDKEKYFTPSIEDIRVGYECEAFYEGKIIQKFVADRFNFPTIIRDLPIMRVPYLTKEQIETEGWEVETDLNNGVVDFKKEKTHKYLSWNYILQNIELNNGRTTTRFDNHLYRGPCRDINTFRMICKLLGI